jgi:site-specific DNA-methyltransferase (adenine-specific)
MTLDERNVGDGLQMLRGLSDSISPLVFFDPQHRSNLDRLKYGNEGVSRGRRRACLPQQSESEIAEFGQAIHRVLKPSGYCARWCNTFELLECLFGIEGLRAERRRHDAKIPRAGERR